MLSKLASRPSFQPMTEIDQDLRGKNSTLPWSSLRSSTLSSSVTQNLLQGIGLIVIDELQMMGNETSWSRLELLLTNYYRLISHSFLDCPRCLAMAKILHAGSTKLLVRDQQACGTEKGSFIQRRFSYLERDIGCGRRGKMALPEPNEYLRPSRSEIFHRKQGRTKYHLPSPINQRRKPGVKSSRTSSIYHLQPVPYWN